VEEWNELQSEHSRLAHGASLVEGVQQAVEVLSETDNACLSLLSGVLSKLNQLRDYDAGLGDVLSMLEPAEIQLQEGIHELRHYLQRLNIDPERLKQCEQRLDEIHSTARKYRVMPIQLPDLLADWNARLEELDTNLDLEGLARQEQEQRQRYESHAKKISAGRKKAAKDLSLKVTAAMQDLAMAGGVFEVALTPLEPGNAHGLEQIDFLVSAHSGTAPKSLGKVASGGELSRISLAIQMAASEVAPVPTLIFDEVDVGIGGSVAETVGKMLKQLGDEYQVLCITHLPQVAALGDQHWVVSKQQVNGAVSSRIQILDKDQRIDEIARMLGGIEITHKTRDHAAEMLGDS
jgi:DNA repair protein RecN (Recombination protein N)